MRIHIGAVGRLKNSSERSLVDDYLDRVRKAGRNAGIIGIEVEEYRESQAATAKLRKAEEAKRLLAGCPPQSSVIVLDEKGTELSSTGLARKLGQVKDRGVQNIVFLIGGPDGHDPDVLNRAELKLALGRMTWPHRLVRIMLAEQIYRSVTILLNHPYHRS